ncbi:hypothetical protein ACS65S_13670, partial [Staphylococcus saprophyticus]
ESFYVGPYLWFRRSQKRSHGLRSFGIFDAFPDDLYGRQAHLSGQVAAALTEKSLNFSWKPPVIEILTSD